jgi:hypothetical protein
VSDRSRHRSSAEPDTGIAQMSAALIGSCEQAGSHAGDVQITLLGAVRTASWQMETGARNGGDARLANTEA